MKHFDYKQVNYDYAAWERAKLYPYEQIVISRRSRPLLGRITGLGWFAIGTFFLAILALVWGGR